MKTKMRANRSKIYRDAWGKWTCVCGNTALDDGFYPCNSQGEVVEPTPEAWTTNCYVCDRCGRIINQETLAVVGSRDEQSSTGKE